MTKKIAFDTLHYAKLLKKGGVQHSEIHSVALADAVTQNIYTKDEVEKVVDVTFKKFDLALRQFEKRTNELRDEFKIMARERAEDRLRSEKEMLKIENRFERALNRHLYTTISVLGGLIVVVGAIATFAHAFFH